MDDEAGFLEGARGLGLEQQGAAADAAFVGLDVAVEGRVGDPRVMIRVDGDAGAAAQPGIG